MVLFYVVAALIATVLAPTGFRFFAVVGSLVSLRFVHLLGQIALDAAPERWKHRARLPLARLGIALPLVVAGCGGERVVTYGCGGHPTTTTETTATTSGACPAMAPTVVCPAGVFNICKPGEFTTSCCAGGVAVEACSKPAGILTTECWAPCASGLCAVAPLDSDASTETSVCCDPAAPAGDPCDKAVAS